MRLLPKERLIQTSAVDHADWNYSPVLAYVMRRRFALVRRFLPSQRVDRILEIGFGSGVFMPELASHCTELYGVDIHSRVEEVRERLSAAGVDASLSRQDAAEMKFPDAYFDVIVCVSSLEFIEDMNGAAREAARVLKRGGRLIGVMPVKSRILDAVLHALTGADPTKDYGERRERVVPALKRYFRIDRTSRFVPAYIAYEMERAA
ncbi:MAG TPA: class I SAM-dependent methyltransferase [Candidatus Baltobacteraceae bacterium]|nr:class I SAM-dependent methyltransferase [Candidatus Baltobacteraceae bacterium]